MMTAIRYTDDRRDIGYHQQERSRRWGTLAAITDVDFTLPAGNTVADGITTLHEYGHWQLDRPERDAAFRWYIRARHETLEEEALAWALAVRWSADEERTRIDACDHLRDAQVEVHRQGRFEECVSDATCDSSGVQAGRLAVGRKAL